MRKIWILSNMNVERFVVVVVRCGKWKGSEHYFWNDQPGMYNEQFSAGMPLFFLQLVCLKRKYLSCSQSRAELPSLGFWGNWQVSLLTSPAASILCKTIRWRRSKMIQDADRIVLMCGYDLVKKCHALLPARPPAPATAPVYAGWLPATGCSGTSCRSCSSPTRPPSSFSYRWRKKSIIVASSWRLLDSLVLIIHSSLGWNL